MKILNIFIILLPLTAFLDILQPAVALQAYPARCVDGGLRNMDTINRFATKWSRKQGEIEIRIKADKAYYSADTNAMRSLLHELVTTHKIDSITEDATLLSLMNIADYLGKGELLKRLYKHSLSIYFRFIVVRDGIFNGTPVGITQLNTITEGKIAYLANDYQALALNISFLEDYVHYQKNLLAYLGRASEKPSDMAPRYIENMAKTENNLAELYLKQHVISDETDSGINVERIVRSAASLLMQAHRRLDFDCSYRLKYLYARKLEILSQAGLIPDRGRIHLPETSLEEYWPEIQSSLTAARPDGKEDPPILEALINKFENLVRQIKKT